MRILKSHPILKMVNCYIFGNSQSPDKSYLLNFGSLLAFCLIIQIVTPVTLAMHYNPSVLEAFNSVEHIIRDVNNGWLIRYLHLNTALDFYLFTGLVVLIQILIGLLSSIKILKDKFNLIINMINNLRSLPSPPQPHAFVKLPLQSSADPWIITISLKIPGMLFTLWDNKENIYMAITAATAAAAGVFVFMADVSTLDPSQITTSTDISIILESLRHATDTEIMSVLDRFLEFWRSAHAEWERYGNLAIDLEREVNAYFTHTIPDYIQEIHDTLLNRINGFGAGRVPNHLLNEYNNIVGRMAAYTNGNAPADLQGQYDNAVRTQETYAYFFNAIEEKIRAIEDMYILKNPNYVQMDLEPL
jgi:VanZ family protein